MRYRLGKEFFAVATFKGLWDISFHTVKKLVVCLGLYESSLHFLSVCAKARKRLECAGTTWNKLKMPWTTWNMLELPGTTWSEISNELTQKKPQEIQRKKPYMQYHCHATLAIVIFTKSMPSQMFVVRTTWNRMEPITSWHK